MDHLSPNRRAWLRFARNRPAFVSGLFLVVAIAVIAFWPWLAPFDPTAVSDAPSMAPDARHWFGTDVHGRDLLTRILFGARISLLVGAVGAAVSLCIGVLWGAVAGYVGGKWDALLMRIVDILYSMPSIVFVIVLITTLETLFKNWLAQHFSPETANLGRLLFLFFGLGAVSWLTMARIVRGQVLGLRNRAFIDASRALGASHARIIFKHILPNVYGVIIVYVTLTIPSVILYESFLSYLGLGIQAPQASLGSLLAEGAAQINPVRVYWWMIVFPGTGLVSMLLALNFTGDGLRDAFDPRGN